jgi:hypothetical protein
MKLAGHVARIGGMFVMPDGKRPLGSSILRREVNIEINIGEIEYGVMNYIDLIWERDKWRALVNLAFNLWVPLNAGKFLSGCTIDGFSSRARFRELSQLGELILFTVSLISSLNFLK